MQEIYQHLEHFFSIVQSSEYFRAIMLVIIGLVVAKIVSHYLVKITSKLMDTQANLLLKRGSYYLVLTLFIISALLELGFDLSVLLGAAGVFSVAIGFASQTSASNLISGLFLMAEKPFTIGDVIEVNGITGEVLSIDMLSVKLRTFDNLFVRIPNETMIKSECTTLTKFPIRRHDINVGVAYKENLTKVKKILYEVADKNPLCLEEPKPLYKFKGYGASSLDIQFSVWATRENYLEMKNSMYEQIKNAFDLNHIEIPFPHISIYSGSQTAAMPVRLKNDDN